MPAHNEERTIQAAVSGVLDVRGRFDLELVVVDDGSTDDTLRLVREIDDPRLTVLSHPRPFGKGAAVLSAAAVATGTHLLVFDADLEYSARDISSLVQPVLEGTAEVVYGARVGGLRTAYQSYRFKRGAELTTWFANVVFDAGLTDMHTCLKLVPIDLFRQLTLTEVGFGLDTELTGELLRRGVRPFEVACAYQGRSRAAGKQISIRDGLRCLRIVVGVRLRGTLEARVPTGPVQRARPDAVREVGMTLAADGRANEAPRLSPAHLNGRATSADHAA